MFIQKREKRLPPWFKIRLTANERLAKVRNLIKDSHLHTVCQSAACPNRTECWNDGTATFLILGDICTRGCRFCNVCHGVPRNPDQDEPDRVADAVRVLGLRYAVITSVTRDDLSDGGATFFASTIRSIRATTPGCRIEVLIPDFNGSDTALDTVLNAHPDVLSHNIETVPSLYESVRPHAFYTRSLEVLKRASSNGLVSKSGLMLGLGEGIDEILSVFRDLRNAACSILTLGQYLQPSRRHIPVKRYYHPDEFDSIREQALAMGFHKVAAGPLVRSSYQAGSY